MELLILTGMSGAGKSQAAKELEDLGFFCIDNVLPRLIPEFVRLISENGKRSKLAVVTDVRSGEGVSEISSVVEKIKRQIPDTRVLFLDAPDEVIINRYRENRRKHPLSNGRNTIAEAIECERKLIEKVKQLADYYIDTGAVSPSKLKYIVSQYICGEGKSDFCVTVKSFGFKYGADAEADLLFDVRCLPNPFYVAELKGETGLKPEVREYVFSTDQSTEFKDKLISFLDTAIPLYESEGKSGLTVSFGCTGGKHRSVTFAEVIGEYLKQKNYNCVIIHRDIEKRW